MPLSKLLMEISTASRADWAQFLGELYRVEVWNCLPRFMLTEPNEPNRIVSRRFSGPRWEVSGLRRRQCRKKHLLYRGMPKS